MDPERWQRIQAVFHEVVDRSEADRAVLLKAACGGDESLMADVAALLREDARSTSVLDREMAQIAHEVLSAPIASLPFEEFGPYRIKGILGEGGMGVVYLAEREDLGSLVAIKILRDAWLSPARLDRFASEQRTLARLNHPSIARLFDADCLPNGTPWFVMEYVDGVPLTDYCRTHQCSVAERLRLFRAVCEAVQYAHSLAIIHRDLKPSNILVNAGGAVKLLDFGIAKQLERLDDAANPTRTAFRMMTPAYAAPEQILGAQVGTPCDVYSLGVILFELLAGQLPFDLSKRTPAEAETDIVCGEPEKPSAVAAKQPAAPQTSRAAWSDLDVLCLTAMHKEPERRYQSVEALIRDVDHYLKGEPLEAQPDNLSYRARKFIHRNRKAVAMAAIVFTVIVAEAGVFTFRLTRARNAAVMQANRSQRIQQFMLNLFGAEDSMAGPGQQLRVVTLIDRGAQEVQALNREPSIQSELYLTLGAMYDRLGKYDQADALLQSARQICAASTGPSSPESAKVLVALSRLRGEQGRLSEAEDLGRQALAIDDRALSRNSNKRAEAESQLGEALLSEAKFDQAITFFQDSIRIQSAPGGEPAELSQSLKDLASADSLTKSYALATSLDRQAMNIDVGIYGPVHPHVAQELSDLASADGMMGNYKEAEDYLRRSVNIDRSWYGSDHPETATQTAKLAQILQAEGKLDESEPLLQQALQVLERAYGVNHPTVATVLQEMVNIDEHRGDFDKAQAELIQIIGIFRSTLGEDNYQTTTEEANLGHLYLERKKYPQAEKIYRDTVALFSKELTPEHPNVGIVQIDLGRVLLREARYQEAEEHTSEGYRILAKQVSPSMNFMKIAYEDLAAEYDGLHEPEKAKQFRTELAAARQ